MTVFLTKGLKAAALAGALATATLVAMPAQAITTSAYQVNWSGFDFSSSVTPSANVDTGYTSAGFTNIYDPSMIVGPESVNKQYRSPFEGSSGYSTAEYFSVGPSTSEPGVLKLNAASSLFSFLLGSPDGYNHLEFFLDGVSQETVNVSSLISGFGLISGSGAAMVYISDLLYDEVQFTSGGKNAFEFANVSSVPLPAGLVLIGTGLAALGFVGRRKKAGKDALSAA